MKALVLTQANHFGRTLTRQVIEQSILRQRCRWSGDVGSAEAGAVVGLQ